MTAYLACVYYRDENGFELGHKTIWADDQDYQTYWNDDGTEKTPPEYYVRIARFWGKRHRVEDERNNSRLFQHCLKKRRMRWMKTKDNLAVTSGMKC